MRFHSDGPSIPNELLDARDNGEVVFFCGAGVSIPAGLPSFSDLAKGVLTDLGVPDDASSHRILKRALAEPDAELRPPMDQVLGLLQRDYGAAQVERAVSRRLRTPKQANLSCHEIILRLSTDISGNPRLVTTNFDLLFERARRSTKYFEPPALPNLSQVQSLDGIVYLHGRLNGRLSATETVRGLILGSPDFGRAYLADGWATQFVRELLARYTVVLLGYSADDPPVRYLLEGLRSRSTSKSQTIYAFAEGLAGEAYARWWDRGVKAITYPKSAGHSALWNSLQAWADRADDPIAWSKSVVDLARRSPRALAPHQRGQVAALVQSPGGAKGFAEADPPPPAEWLCVFDAEVRYAKVQPVELTNEAEPFDPLTVYGLDDDPLRRDDGSWENRPAGIDLLSPLSAEERGPNYTRLGGVFARRSDPLPPRLNHLARWIARIASDPAAVWWAAGKGGLHHSLQDLIEHQINRGDVGAPVVRKLWRLLFEGFEGAFEPHGLDRYDLERLVKRDGWTKGHLREFDRVVRPRLHAQGPSRYASLPPEVSVELAKLSDIARVEVRFLEQRQPQIAIPDAILPAIVGAIRKGLEHAASLLADLDTKWWRTPTLHPEDKPGERYLSKADAYFIWFVTLYDQLCRSDIRLARRELSAWPENEPFFFDKLRIWEWMKPEIVTPSDAMMGLLALSADAFWSQYSQRELLWTLRARWGEWPQDERQAIEDKIIEGPEQWDQESREDYSRRRGAASAVRLGWLQSNGCILSERTNQELQRLRAADPRWQQSWDQHADESMEGRSGWVRLETDPSQIVDTPISEVVERARQYTSRRSDEFIEYGPFQGLVQTKPVRALAALSYEARRGRFPTEFWRTILSDWPQSASSRAGCVLAQRIARLPRPLLIDLRYYAPAWLKTHLSQIADNKACVIWHVWDSILDALIEAGPEATTSSIGDVTIGGVKQKRSRRTYDHAINSPVGHLTECLLNFVAKIRLGESAGLPDLVMTRLERAMTVAGEGGDHAVAILCRNLNRLYWLDPDWTIHHLTPRFELNHEQAEPAWNGFLWNNHLPAPALFKRIKPAFLRAFARLADWQWDEAPLRRLSEFLVVAVVESKRKSLYLTSTEARVALQSSDDRARAAALWQLHSVIQKEGGWKQIGRPFLERVWPKEARYQTGETSQTLTEIAMNAGDSFPQCAQIILPFLRATERADRLILDVGRTGKDEDNPLAERFPRETIDLLDALVADQPRSIPYGLGEILERTATADATLRQDLRWRRLNDLLTAI